MSTSGKKLIEGHPVNPRNLLSAQRKYANRVRNKSYDPEGRSLPQGVEGEIVDGQPVVKLMARKQLAKGIYRAWADDPENPNVAKAINGGYWTAIRPANLP